jgi:hypothetical protein
MYVPPSLKLRISVFSLAYVVYPKIPSKLEGLYNIFNKIFFLREKLLTPHPNPNLGDRPLSAVRDCLLNIFAATLYFWRPPTRFEPQGVPYRFDKAHSI